MNAQRRGLLLSFVSFGILSGCGYQLRGWDLSNRQPLPYQRIYVLGQGADSEVVAQVKRVFEALGATLVTDVQQAEVEVLLGATEQNSVTSAIGSYGEISARLFIMNQPIRVRRLGGDQTLIDTVIRRSREVDQNLATQIGGLGAERPLAITRESEDVLIDIRARVVDAIVRLIQGLVPLDNPS